MSEVYYHDGPRGVWARPQVKEISPRKMMIVGGRQLFVFGTLSVQVLVNQPYGGPPLTGKGGNPPYTFSIFSGSLPTGMSLNSTTGAITGTPTVTGTYSVVFRVTDSQGKTDNSISQSILVYALPTTGVYDTALWDSTLYS